MAALPKLVVLLRAVNVARHGRVAMADVRSVLAAAGYRDVATYLQTGNLIISTRRSARIVVADVERVLAAELGLTTQPTARTAARLATLAATNPFAARGIDARSLAVGFCATTPRPASVAALTARDFGDDEWSVVGPDVFLHTPNGLGRSKLAAALEKTLAVSVTVRNWNVTTALAARAQA